MPLEEVIRSYITLISDHSDSYHNLVPRPAPLSLPELIWKLVAKSTQASPSPRVAHGWRQLPSPRLSFLGANSHLRTQQHGGVRAWPSCPCANNSKGLLQCSPGGWQLLPRPNHDWVSFQWAHVLPPTHTDAELVSTPQMQSAWVCVSARHDGSHL
jgi:hypothetical protein